MSSTTVTATSSTARKVIGSLGVLGAAAAVAGLGTFGTFTDSATPVQNATVDSGTLSISATRGDSLPLNVANLVPGDTITRAITIKNDGNLPLGSVSLAATAAAPASILTTDATNGLQMAVKSCAVAWTPGANNTLTCSSGERSISTGQIIRNVDLGAVASLAANGTDYIAYTVSLPLSADNTFQGKSAALTLTVTGAQKTGTTR
ncbi:TasA family protein [Blastococcus sp. TF02A_35]|uniref:TasA family protein n=1 Tax=Blastococcus sp. TF02A-35 TaxID=2559612 RepID=UPI0010744A23|nr:TasA family protein [Blastococcus sp. TF02A_35]TFV52732.1 hypothetical protein E4P43_05410 [Blastococcus sp. TF02A_35]